MLRDLYIAIKSEHLDAIIAMQLFNCYNGVVVTVLTHPKFNVKIMSRANVYYLIT